MFNQGIEVLLKGNLTRDPEMRYMPDGTAVTNINVAANRVYTDPHSGEKVQETTWTRCSIWGAQAEAANEYLVRGQQVVIRGRLQPDPQTGHPRIYQRNDGTVGTGYDIRVFNIDYGPKPQDNGQAAEDLPSQASLRTKFPSSILISQHSGRFAAIRR